MFASVNNPLMEIWKLTYEMVNPLTHPQYHKRHSSGTAPALPARLVPDEHWVHVECVVTREEDKLSLIDQYGAVTQRAADGELVRKPRIWKCDAVWIPVTA